MGKHCSRCSEFCLNIGDMQRIKETAVCCGQETKYNRATVFKSILAAINEADEDKRTIERMIYYPE